MAAALTRGDNWRDRALVFFVTAGYAGFSKRAPGTVGSLVGLVLYLPLAMGAGPLLPLAALLSFFLGVFASSQVANLWRVKDPQAIVIDEVAGMWIALLFVPFELVNVIAAFTAFRLCDIFKPFPARQAEALPGGWGIMADDVVAGIYANLAVRVIDWLL